MQISWTLSKGVKEEHYITEDFKKQTTQKNLEQFYKAKKAIWSKKQTSEIMSKRRKNKHSINIVKFIAIYTKFWGAFCWRNQYLLQTYQNQTKPPENQ